jgi:hypothetical protein
MDLSTLAQILNNGIPAGIISKVAADLIVKQIDKVKTMFNGKVITKEKLEQLMAENDDLKETMAKLQLELTKENIINNADIIEIKNQFNYSTFNNATF